MIQAARFKTCTFIACGVLLGASVSHADQPSGLELPAPISASDFRPFNEKRAALGQLLFYDKILSGNRNIACSTCHAVAHGTSDGLSLGIGEGGVGLGPERRVVSGPDHPFKRVPRNATSLFNLGHRSIDIMFHDGRVSADDSYGVGFNSPVEEWLPEGLQSVVAAQALMPVISKVEMAGQTDENELAAAINRRIDQAWPAIVARILAVPEYVDLFMEAYPELSDARDISPVHIANALDDFQNAEWRSFSSPFDAYLAGDENALSDDARAGMALFYGDAGCADCHSGPLLTDQDFHALTLPPLGPGRNRRFEHIARDVGRMSESDLLEDAYRFRTPSLRNVAMTGPWGHNGTFATLEGIVRHHLDPQKSFDEWDRGQVVLTPAPELEFVDFVIWEDSREMARQRAAQDIVPVALSDAQVDEIVAFLDALTDCDALSGRFGIPVSVPSGLSIDASAEMPELCKP